MVKASNHSPHSPRPGKKSKKSTKSTDLKNELDPQVKVQHSELGLPTIGEIAIK